MGPSGLSALKFLREQGFDVTCFEQKSGVGGVWTGSEDARYTAALKSTVLGNSKFGFSMSDFPHLNKDCPIFPSATDLETHFRAYADHYGLHSYIRYNTIITRIERDDVKEKWILHIRGPDGIAVMPFDKVVAANGIQNKAVMPSCPGIETFSGLTMHSQAFKFRKEDLKKFQDKRVLLVGLGNTSCDICIELTGFASKIHIAHRRGRKLLSRYDENGLPVDLGLSWSIFQGKNFMDWKLPSFTAWALDNFMTSNAIASAAKGEPSGSTPAEKKKIAEKRLREEWKLLPAPSLRQVNPVVSESLYDSLRSGNVSLVSGFKGFKGDKVVSFEDGTELEVDAVIFCTGYKANWDLFPDLPMNGSCGVPTSTASKVGDSHVPNLPRLYQNIFPTQWASSLAFTSYNHPQDNNPATQELISMAVAQIWAADAASKLQNQKPAPAGYRPPARLPPVAEMERAIDEWQTWWRSNWKIAPGMLESFLPHYPWYRFLHDAAGTGMFENLGHFFALDKGWGLWWRDPDMYKWMTKAPSSNVGFRVFETNPLGIPGCGRSTWSGAREALREIYEGAEDFKAKAKAKTVKQA
ncbi:hypothetical protein N0V82_010391 [Gnomoniopsis sp. IMI 355080]|nr:hypothetical protein N0V82_010391 [Gnomoniopsis sp. IMI 355080]